MKTWLLAACAVFTATLSTRAADQCVWVHNIDNFRPAQDEKSVIISDSPSRKYTVTFQGRCLGLRFTETIAVRSVGNMFCLTPGDVVSFSDNGARQRCMMNTELATLPMPEANCSATTSGITSQYLGWNTAITT